MPTDASKTATDMIIRWSRRASGILALVLLAIFLYLDHAYNVADAIPLRHRPPAPFTMFLMLGTVCYPIGAAGVLMSLRDLRLVSRFRSSQAFAATSERTSELKGH